jgi:hypothetical protein
MKKTNLRMNCAGSTLSPTRPRLMPSTMRKLRGRRPDIHQLHYAKQTTNTTFRDRHPDIPPLALEPRRRTTQPPAVQNCTEKTARRPQPPHQHPEPPPRPKSQPPPLRRVNRADNLAALATQDRHPSHAKKPLRHMKHLFDMVSEAAASTRKNIHSGPLPRLPPT